jgi:hypothetical protein
MKWYFASRMHHQSKLVDIATFLTNKGEVILSEWIYEDSLKPYTEHLTEVRLLAKKVVSSLLKTDIFVLISDSGGTDMFVELGVCLARNDSPQKPRIYIVGEYGNRSLMQLHPMIVHAKNIEEVFSTEKVKHDKFNDPTF